MPERQVIHPLNRGIRPIRVELEIESGKVVGAKVGTTYYWDFAGTLTGKDPLDAIQLTQRSNGLDFVSHATAAVRAMEAIALAEVGDTALVLRNILLALDMVYGHITHFYQNVLPDYIPFPAEAPFYGATGDFRIIPAVRDSIIKNVWRAFSIRQLIHQMMAMLGGKTPHICSIVFGGVTKTPNSADIIRVNSILKEVAGFINNEYSTDLGQVETTYPQYFRMGAGSGNLLTVGEFPLKKQGHYLIPGRANFRSAELDKRLISMDYTGSWFTGESETEGGMAAIVKPSPEKMTAYSWTKGATYDGKTCEVGAFARMTVYGNSAIAGMGNQTGSVLGRYRARLEESKMLLDQISGWLGQLDPAEKPVVKTDVPEKGEAIGVAEASHGSVVHYLKITGNKIERYNVLDSHSWNLCPFTRGGQRGPIEQALIGLSVSVTGLSPDVLRVARSF